MSVTFTMRTRKDGRPSRLDSWVTMADCTCACSTLAAVTTWPPTPPIVKEKVSSTSATGVDEGVCDGVDVMVDVDVDVEVAVAVAEAVDEVVELAVAELVAVADDVAVAVGGRQIPESVFAVEELKAPYRQGVQAAAPAAAHEAAAHGAQAVVAAPTLLHAPVAALRLHEAVGPA